MGVGYLMEGIVHRGKINVAKRTSTRGSRVCTERQRAYTQRMLSAAASDTPIPPEWVNLFLTMSDVVDGGGFTQEYRTMLLDAYQAIFATPLGLRIYGQMVDEGAALLAGGGDA